MALRINEFEGLLHDLIRLVQTNHGDSDKVCDVARATFTQSPESFIHFIRAIQLNPGSSDPTVVVRIHNIAMESLKLGMGDARLSEDLKTTLCCEFLKSSSPVSNPWELVREYLNNIQGLVDCKTPHRAWEKNLVKIAAEVDHETFRLLCFELIKKVPSFFFEQFIAQFPLQQSDSEAIAMLLKTKFPKLLLRYVDKLAIQSQSLLGELAACCLELDYANFCGSFFKFRIIDEQVKGSLARLVNVKFPRNFFQCIHWLNFSPDHLSKIIQEFIVSHDELPVWVYHELNKIYSDNPPLEIAIVVISKIPEYTRELAFKPFELTYLAGNLEGSFALVKEVMSANGNCDVTDWISPGVCQVDPSCPWKDCYPDSLFPPDQIRELARVCAEHCPTAPRKIEKFPILSDGEKTELIFANVKKFPRAIVHSLHLMAHPDWASLFRGALQQLSNQGNSDVIRRILDSIFTSKSRISLGEWRSPGLQIERHEPLPVLDRAKKLEILEICAAAHPMMAASWVDQVNLPDEQDRRRIAEACVGLPLATYINRFAIKLNLQEKVDYATRCCCHDPAVIPWLQFFQLSAEDDFKILMRVSQEYDVIHIVNYFPSNKLSDDQVIQLIEMCLQRDSRHIDRLGPLFHACAPQTVVRWLGEYVQTPNPSFPRSLLLSLFFVEKFTLENRYLIAQIFARANPEGCIRHFDVFRIEDVEQTIDLLKCCFSAQPDSVWFFFQKSFGWPKQKTKELTERLKSLLFEWANIPNSHFPKYFNSDMAQLLGLSMEEIGAIALSCAQQQGLLTAAYFDSLPLAISFRSADWHSPLFGPLSVDLSVDPEVMLNVIEALSQTAPSRLAPIISPRRIPSKTRRLAFARVAVVNDPSSLRHFRGWDLPKEKFDELIKAYREHFPEEFKKECIYVIDSRFVPQVTERIELAKIAAQYNPVELTHRFRLGHIPDDQLAPLLFVMANNTDQIYQFDVGKRDLYTCDRLFRLLSITQPDFFTMQTQSASNQSFHSACRILRNFNRAELPVFLTQYYPLIRNYLSIDPRFDVQKFPETIQFPPNPSLIRLLKELLILYVGTIALPRDRLSVPIVAQTFQKIQQLRHGPHALQLIAALAYYFSDHGIRALELLTKGKKQGGNVLAPLLVPMVLVAKWAGESQWTPDLETLLTQINHVLAPSIIVKEHFRKQAFVPQGLMQSLMRMLSKMNLNPHMSPLEKIQVLKEVLTKPPGVEASVRCMKYIEILLPNPDRRWLSDSFDESMEQRLQEAVVAIELEGGLLPEVPDVKKKYCEQLLFPLRVPGSWKSFYHSLELANRGDLLKRYKKMLVAVLNGTYEAERNEGSSPHIARLKAHDLQLWNSWVIGTPSRQELLLTGQNQVPFNFSQFLKTEILDGHFRNDRGEEVSQGLVDWANGRVTAEELLQELSAKEETGLPQKELDFLRFQKEIIISAVKKGLSGIEMSSQVLELKEKLALISVDPRRELPYFERALSGLMQQRHHECEPHSLSCSIENIGSSFRDMLESGTVVTGSCQNVYPSPGGAQLNIGLMGPLSDPKIRMLQVVDFETEEVMGRAFLRILWNQTTGRPILHLDRIYANGSAEAVSDLIHNEAQQIASGMNLDLLTAKVTQGEETKDEILSFGTVAGCEYSDAMHGLTNGVYKIPLAYLTK